MRALRFHYRPVRYLLTRLAGGKKPTLALSPFGCASLDEVEPPALPGPEWVRVETLLSGICGSDLAALTAHDSFTLEPFGAYPFTFGHENVGRVVETGAAAAEWRAGERVIVNPMLACRQRGLADCPACARGEYGLCRCTRDGSIGTGPMIGYCPSVGGGWSRSFVAHKSQLKRAHDLADEVAVLTDPFASALRPVLLHAPQAGDVVLVIGVGSIGALTIKALRLTGWRGPIAVVARHAFQQQLAERAGADTILRSNTELYAWAERLPQARAYKPTLAARFVEGGPSLVYDTVGTHRSMSDALALTREGGRIVLVGAAARMGLDWTRVWYRQLTVAGVFAYGLVQFEDRSRDIYDVSIDLIRSDDLAELGLVTHIFDLEDYRAALAAALDKNGHRSIKVVFRPAGG
ncbi:MAG: zinc-dependent alcohol dehydrogenase [Longimicrobiales bacterium]